VNQQMPPIERNDQPEYGDEREHCYDYYIAGCIQFREICEN
jgi:hypothetical protein